MNQLSVSYEEIENRLAICCEFLMDRKKSIEEAYESLMGKLGRKIMEYTEFEYWFKRFQNNQFDLGYDNSQDKKEISEIQNTMDSETSGVQDDSTVIIEKEASVEKADIQIEDSNLNHQFNEKNVPEIFKTFINDRITDLKEVYLILDHSYCSVKFNDSRIRFVKNADRCTVTYDQINTTIETADLEKSIIDHFWFVLRNPNIELGTFRLDCEAENHRNLDSAKLNLLLQSMLNSFDHQISTSSLHAQNFNEDTLYSMLKCVKPGTLETISFEISGDSQKLKEIVMLDQWQQAKQIWSTKPTSLTFDDVSHCEIFSLCYEDITPEDVVRVRNHFLKLPITNRCVLSVQAGSQINFDTIGRALESGNVEPRIKGTNKSFQIIYRFSIQNSQKMLLVHLKTEIIVFRIVDNYE